MEGVRWLSKLTDIVVVGWPEPEMKGTEASISIQSNCDLEATGKLLSEALSLPAFWLKSDPFPPHSFVAMCECMGLEMWLGSLAAC